MISPWEEPCSEVASVETAVVEVEEVVVESMQFLVLLRLHWVMSNSGIVLDVVALAVVALVVVQPVHKLYAIHYYCCYYLSL